MKTSVWLTQKAMAELFGVKIPAISKHLSNIFESGELQNEATVSILETDRSNEKKSSITSKLSSQSVSVSIPTRLLSFVSGLPKL